MNISGYYLRYTNVLDLDLDFGRIYMSMCTAWI